MPRPKKWPPSITTKGQRSYVRIDGHDWPLGLTGSDQAKREYARLVAEAARGTLGKSKDDLTIGEAYIAFMKHAEAKYRSGEAENYRYALRPLLEVHGPEAVASFGTKKLRALRDEMGRLWRRTHANRNLVRVRTMFRWLEAEELAPAGLYNTLLTVTGLGVGEAAKGEGKDVLPVREDVLAATLPRLNAVVRAAVELQLLTAARPAEVLRLRPGDVLREGKAELMPGVTLELGAVWAAPLAAHKTAHKGKLRVLLFGPKAQDVLRPLLDRPAGARLFNPREAAAGKVPPRLFATLGDHYTTESYRQAIHRGCTRAKVDLWSPNQLRHNAATRLRAEFGIELARIILGHSSTDTTAIYAMEDLKAAVEAMKKVG